MPHTPLKQLQQNLEVVTEDYDPDADAPGPSETEFATRILNVIKEALKAKDITFKEANVDTSNPISFEQTITLVENGMFAIDVKIETTYF